MFRKWILLSVLSLFTLNTHAAVGMFLKIDGVEGESRDDQHRGAIDVLAWSWAQAVTLAEFASKTLASQNT